MKEIQEQYGITNQDLNAKVKSLEKDKNLLTERLELANRDQVSEQTNLSKKLDKSLEHAQRLSDELEAIKEDRDRKHREF